MFTIVLTYVLTLNGNTFCSHRIDVLTGNIFQISRMYVTCYLRYVTDGVLAST